VTATEAQFAPPSSPDTADVPPAMELSRRLRLVHWLLLVLILIVAAAARMYHIGTQSLWRDELFSLESSAGWSVAQDVIPRDRIVTSFPDPTGLRDARPLITVATAMRGDTHPPLYPLTLRLWRAAFGEGDAAARSLSALISVLGVALLFDAVRLLHASPSPALWAAAVMALAGPQIEFAQAARGYAMVVTLVLGCVAVLARIERSGATLRRCVALAAFLMLAMLTHYGAAAALLAVAVYTVLRLRGADRTRTLIAFAVAAVLYLAFWGPILWQQRPNFSANMMWTVEPRDVNLRMTPLRILDLPMTFLFTPLSKNVWVGRALAVVYVAPLLMFRRRPALMLWWMMLVLVVGSVAASDLARSANMLTMIRYTLIASAAAYVIFVVVLSNLGGRIGQLAPAAIVLACALALPNAYTARTADYRAFGRYVYRNAKPNDLLIFVGTEDDLWLSALLHMSITHYRIAEGAGYGSPCAVAFTTTHAPQGALLEQIRAWHGDVWLIEPWSTAAGTTLPGSHYVEGEFFPTVATVTRVRF
jgi:uncharacterized membrane protein